MAKALTELAITMLKPRAARYERRDPGMDGLVLVVQPTGTKSWTFRFRYGRRQRRLNLGTWPGITLVKARRRAEAAVTAIERGEDPAYVLYPPKRDQYITTADREAFGLLMRRWFHDHAIPNTRSWRETARLVGLKIDKEKSKPEGPVVFDDVKGGIVARWAERPVSGISRRDVRELLDDSKARGASTTANRELAALKTFFNWCVDREIIEVSPALRLAKPAVEGKRTRILSDDERRVIWFAAEAEGYPFGDIVRLLMLTGQRRGEVAGAARLEFDLKAKAWIIPEERTKNGLPHLVPLSTAALDILENVPRIANATFMFGLGGRTGFTGYSKAKARLDEDIEKLNDGALPEWNLHDLRRTAATSMARLGVLPHVVEAILSGCAISRQTEGSTGGLASST